MRCKSIIFQSEVPRPFIIHTQNLYVTPNPLITMWEGPPPPPLNVHSQHLCKHRKKKSITYSGCFEERKSNYYINYFAKQGYAFKLEKYTGQFHIPERRGYS